MRSPVLAVAVALAMFGCEAKKSTSDQPASNSAAKSARAPLVDLTSTSSLGAVREAFNAHEGEARFLTLLSPT